MATAIAGYRQSLTSGGGAQSITIGANGDYEVTVRALSPGIFVGGANVAGSLPNTGFELIPDTDYTFSVVSAADYEPYLATTSGSAVFAYVFIRPRL
jgi:hypothetical protein